MVSKVAVVGYGSAGRRAVRELRSLIPQSEFLVLTKQDISADELDVTPDYEGILAFAPDLVVLANPASERKKAVMNLVDTGASFFMEKPLAHSLEDALQIVDALEQAKVRTGVGYNFRFSRSLNEFRKVIWDSALGSVLSVRIETGQYLPDWRPSRDYRETVSAQAGLGGGVLLELSHEIDYLRWIFGPVMWASAWIGKTSDLEITVEDTAILSLGIKGGSDSPELVSSVALDFLRRDRTRLMTAICENGTIRWDGISGTTTTWGETSEAWDIIASDSEGESTYRTQWSSFLASLRGSTIEQGTGASVRESMEAMKVVEAARRSHSNGGARVEITDVGGGR